MGVVTYAPAAQADLRKIASEIIANNGPRVAQKYLNETKSSFELLAEYPFVGRKRSRLGKGLFSWPIRPYIVLYKPADDGVQIVRVLHGSRRITRRLVEEN
jgi:toxin ParE1/3/4